MNRKLILILTLLLASVLLFSACGGNVAEQETGGKELEFKSNGNGTCAVSGIGTYTDTEIVIPTTSPAGDRVTGIGGAAFKNCTNLTGVVIPSGVTYIGYEAFNGCTGLTTITLPESITSVGEKAFYNCENLQYTIYENAQYLGNERNPYVALINATDTEIPYCTIHPSTKVIGVSAFENCYNLESIAIPAGVAGVGIRAFCKCYSLGSITVDKENPVFHSAGNCLIKTATKTLVAGCSNSKIPADGSVTKIGDYAFYDCPVPWLTLVIPDGVTSIGASAFVHSGLLIDVVFPNTLTSIGKSAFGACTYLTSVTIPDSVIKIGACAFSDCLSLTNVTIGSNVASIGVGVFQSCSNLERITVSKKNTAYHSTGSCLIETASKTLIAGCKTSVIPTDGSVSKIENYAFYFQKDLLSVVIPNSVTSIGRDAFSGCTGLTSVTIPDSVISIESYAFYGCESLTEITYQGTMEQWGAIEKINFWDVGTGEYTIYCTDGDIAK